jgi:hypothetical protein
MKFYLFSVSFLMNEKSVVNYFLQTRKMDTLHVKSTLQVSRLGSCLPGKWSLTLSTTRSTALLHICKYSECQCPTTHGVSIQKGITR